MRKFFTSLLIIAVVVVGGLWYGKKLVTQTISTKVATMISSPSGKQTLNQVLHSKEAKDALKKVDTTSTLNTTSGGSSTTVHFANEQQAVQFALSRVSIGQLMQWEKDYQNRNSLTVSQKKSIESEVLSYFTVDQLKAMASVVQNQK